MAFISAAGITLEHGLTTSRSGAGRHAERGRRGRGGQKVGLLDSTKFTRSSLLTVRRRSRSTSIITDDGLDPATVAEFRAAGVNLVVAERGPVPTEDPQAD